MNEFITGAIAMGYFIAGLFFLRFWKSSRDRLFAFFAVAFWILGVQRSALGLTTQVTEGYLALYIMRLAAFLLILIAIVDKNRSRSE